MKKCKKMPKSGQFIAVWEYNGKIWSKTFKRKNGVLFKCDNGWKPTIMSLHKSITVKYYKVK